MVSSPSYPWAQSPETDQDAKPGLDYGAQDRTYKVPAKQYGDAGCE
jgi:hypothetical protein